MRHTRARRPCRGPPRWTKVGSERRRHRSFNRGRHARGAPRGRPLPRVTAANRVLVPGEGKTSWVGPPASVAVSRATPSPSRNPDRRSRPDAGAAQVPAPCRVDGGPAPGRRSAPRPAPLPPVPAAATAAQPGRRASHGQGACQGPVAEASAGGPGLTAPARSGCSAYGVPAPRTRRAAPARRPTDLIELPEADRPRSVPQAQRAVAATSGRPGRSSWSRSSCSSSVRSAAATWPSPRRAPAVAQLARGRERPQRERQPDPSIPPPRRSPTRRRSPPSAASEAAAKAKNANEVAASGAGGGQPRLGAPAGPGRPRSCSSTPATGPSAARCVLQAGFGLDQMVCLDKLFTRESGWNPSGEEQAGLRRVRHPAGRAGRTRWRRYGSDWQTNPVPQINWGLNYIKGRYDQSVRRWAHSAVNGLVLGPGPNREAIRSSSTAPPGSGRLGEDLPFRVLRRHSLPTHTA